MQNGDARMKEYGGKVKRVLKDYQGDADGTVLGNSTVRQKTSESE